MKRTLAALLLMTSLLIAGSPAGAQDRKPLTVGEAMNMLAALRNLDGRPTVMNQGIVVVPYDFGSGALRLRISRNIAALAEIEKSTEESRQAIIREILRKMPPGPDGKAPVKLDPGTPEFEDFSKQYGTVLAELVNVSLTRIRASELKLDKNEIPATALNALVPIFDDDVTLPAGK
jgi:hypothetical protein